MKKLLNIIFLLSILLIFTQKESFAFPATIDGNNWNLENHPRLLAVPVTELKAKTIGNPIWTLLTNRISGYMTSYWNPVTHTWTGTCASMPWGAGDDAVLGVMSSMSLYYLMYPNTPLNGAESIEYGRMAKATLEGLADGSCGFNDSQPWETNVNRDYGSVYLPYMARIWDYIYNVDSDRLISGDNTFKENFLTWINQTMIPMVESHEIFSGVNYGFNKNWDIIPPESNLMLTAWRGRTFIGLATYEDNLPAKTYATTEYNSEKYVNDGYGWWAHHLSQHKNIYMQGGHGFDGSHYQLYRTNYYTLDGMNALTLAINEVDTFNDVVGNWVEEQALYGIQRTIPGAPTVTYLEGVIGDREFPLGSNWPRALSDLLFISHKYKDSYAGKVARNFFKTVYNPNVNTSDIAHHYMDYWFMLWDNDESEIDYKTLPTVHYAEGTGLLISKTGWNASDTWTNINFTPSWANRHSTTNSTKSTDFTRGVYHSAGSYSLIKNGEYLIYENIPDAGTIEGAHNPENYNSIRIGETISNYWGATQTTGGFYPFSGVNYGYVGADAQYAAATPVIEAYKQGNMRYLKSDMTNAYVREINGGGGAPQPAIADKVYRSFVHSTEAGLADYIIVYDYINKNNDQGTRMVTSRIHYPGNPSIVGATVNYSNSTATVKTNILLPITPTITKSTPINHTNKIDGDTPYKIDIQIGENDITRSLIVHEPSMNGVVPADISLIDETNFVGAFILDPDINRVVLFKKDEESGEETFTTTLTVTTSNIRMLITDLIPDTQYHYIQNLSGDNLTFSLGASGTAIVSDSNGVITLLLNGTNSSEIRSDVDQNSSINSTDAMLTLRNSLGLDMSGTNWQASATTGDVNCDDITNSTDAMLILRQSLGLDMTGTGWCGN